MRYEVEAIVPLRRTFHVTADSPERAAELIAELNAEGQEDGEEEREGETVTIVREKEYGYEYDRYGVQSVLKLVGEHGAAWTGWMPPRGRRW